MAELVADCPRCSAKHVTCDVPSSAPRRKKVRFYTHEAVMHEAFCVCRACGETFIALLVARNPETERIVSREGPAAITRAALNDLVVIRGYVGLKDEARVQPPEHLPEEISRAFVEGATCQAVGCYNAAAAMFRTCVDFASKAKLPEADIDGLNAKIRRSLGWRLEWLFKQRLLPAELEDLAECIKEDGNDGAHDCSLSEQDAEDLLDFTVALLERLYTEPRRLEIARERRDARRAVGK